MEGLSRTNIVVVGSNFPVQTVALEDFTGVLGEMSEVVRLPVLVQGAAGSYRIAFTEERFSVEVVPPFPADDVSRLVEATRMFLMEYVGRRAASGVGHNFSGVLGTGEVAGRDVLPKLLNTVLLQEVLQSTEPLAPSLSVNFRRGQESRAKLSLGAPLEEEARHIAYDFNFHFDLKGSDKVDVMEAVDQLPDSVVYAEGIVETLSSRVTRVGEEDG